jgi:hypothetical protein
MKNFASWFPSHDRSFTGTSLQRTSPLFRVGMCSTITHALRGSGTSNTINLYNPMKLKTIRTRFAALVAMALLCCSALLTTSGTAWAQCPSCSCPAVPVDDARNNPANPPWQQCLAPMCITYDGCAVSVCYADRCSSIPPSPCYNYDYVVTQVCVDSACFAMAGGTLTGLIGAASDSLMVNNPAGFYCPTCPNSTIFWSENECSCWSTPVMVYNPVTGKTTEQDSICSTHGWCLNEFSVCCDGGGKHFTFIQNQNRSYECGSGCNALDSCTTPNLPH